MGIIHSVHVGSLSLLLLSAYAMAGEPSAAVSELAGKYWDASMRRYPTWATAVGDHRFDDRLDDLSDRAVQAWRAELDRFALQAQRLREGPLSDNDSLTVELLERSIIDDQVRIVCGGHLMPLDPMYGPHLRLPLLLNAQPFHTKADFEAYLARLRAFPQQVADVIDNMRFGVRAELVSPQVIVERVIPQIRRHITPDAMKSEFFAPAEKMETLPPEDRETLRAALAEAIRTCVVPAYLQLLGYVQDDYLHRARASVGLSALPNGDSMYAALVQLHTTVDVSPDEVHALGLSEVARIRREMEKIKDEVGFDGDLDAFLQKMRTDPAQRFTSAEELLSAATAFLERAKEQMPKLFGRLPAADCKVKAIEDYRADSAMVAFYDLPPEDRSRPGYYYVNTYAPQERLRFTLEALTYHEAVPGHHLQMALDQENAALPAFRRYARFTAYEEGWALYAEKLGYEIGGYRDPYQRFGQLTFEMWRACRLVVDTGIHAKGWTRARAIEYLAANTSLAKLDIENEVDRYITWPGQALAYKIGELRILALRQLAGQTLGDRFDLRAFHDTLLAAGAMPIDMLERRMKAWIEAPR